ncbi:tachykinins isoform X2 [Culicoides brevitarsis]|uniref:tachykinins isoform X2 n=1 Tax=Culicoides brevitarsis TaxID=469753 RepID=UPI00307C61FE
MMNILIVSTLFLILNISQEIYANPHHRREPVGFQGTRGRRSVDFDNKSINSKDDSVQTEQEAPFYVNSVTTESISNDEPVGTSPSSLSIVKRAPAMGFQGVRGKKFDEFYADLDKRLPMGFQGVRGKKLLINYPHLWYYSPKRAPSGFMGMRGKKSYDYDEGALDKRAPSGFMGMRGKRPEDFEQQYDNYSSNDDDLRLYQALMSGADSLNHWYEDQLNELDPNNIEEYGYEKRAPAGFVGMRGRRFYDSDLFQTLESKKRAPSGFTAMRGKRAPSGFMGMRGKKDDPEMLDNYEKRAPAAGFLGMRGKKGPLFAYLQGNSFFGTRGKKFPYEFRSKFIGVRGKKAFNSENEIEETEQLENNMEKRKPNGFVGMRGKKDSESSQE